MVGRVNGVLGGILAPESFVLSQSYYFGSVAGKPPVQIRRVHGDKIDRRDDLEEIRPAPRGTDDPEDAAVIIGIPINYDVLIDRLAYIDPLCANGELKNGTRALWRNVIWAIASTPLVGSAVPWFTFDEEAKRLEIAQAWSRGEYDHLHRYDDNPPATWGIDAKGDAVDTDAEIEELFRQNKVNRSSTVSFGTIDALARQGGYKSPSQLLAATEPTAPKKSANRFLAAHKKPSEQANRPPIEYLDTAETIARVPEVITIVAPQGHHKTGLMLKLALDAHERGLSVLFVAVEDGYGVSVARIPACLRVRGLPPDHLDQGRWVTVEENFNFLRDGPELIDFCNALGFKPDAIFVDVLGKAASGVTFDSSKDVAILMGNAVDIATTLGAPMVISAHPRKNSETGQISGSHLFSDLAYGELHVQIVGNKMRVKIHKNKNGPADRLVWYELNHEAGTGVPIIGGLTTGTLPPEKIEARNAVAKAIEEMMTFMRTHNMTEPVTDRVMARLMSGKDAKDPETTKIWEKIRHYHTAKNVEHMWPVGRKILNEWHWQLREHQGLVETDIEF